MNTTTMNTTTAATTRPIIARAEGGAVDDSLTELVADSLAAGEAAVGVAVVDGPAPVASTVNVIAPVTG